VKIKKVDADTKRRRFEVTTSRGILPFPFARCDPTPSTKDRIEEVYVDPELGREAFTYKLASGAEGSVHVDSVLDVNADPEYLAELELYRLTLEARKHFGASGLSIRDAAARLNTSPTQLYRILDPANGTTSARHLLAVLALAGASLEVAERPPARPPAKRATVKRVEPRRKKVPA
jgi:hypothetical protein